MTRLPIRPKNDVADPHTVSNERAATKERTQHEHVTAPIQAQADKLLRQAGSPEIAKQAVEAAANQKAPATHDKDEFARRWGFASYLALFEDSKATPCRRNGHWMLTALQNGHWILWNADDLTMVQEFETVDEAHRAAM